MLLVDIGNSRIKWAFWQNNKLEDYFACEYQADNLQNILSKNLSHCAQQTVYLCSVVSADINQLIKQWFNAQWQTEVTQVAVQAQQLGLTNAYENVNALGADRWMAMLGACHQYNKAALCVIDCGTAVTIDVVDQTGQHMGGLIMPGIRMQQQALLNGTQKIDSIQGEASMLANNTEDAVIGGSVHLLVTGLDGLYKKYAAQLNTELVCVVTGGDGETVMKAMDSHCHYERDLILYGLSRVAQAED